MDDWKSSAVLNADESENTFQVTDDFWGSGHSREMWGRSQWEMLREWGDAGLREGYSSMGG